MHFDLEDIEFIGQNLVRPECVIATAAGSLYVSDFRGGVSQVRPDGSTRFFGGGEVEGIGQLKPNGICLQKDGSFLVAHLGDEVGGIYRIERSGQITPFLTKISGETLPPTNFIYLDYQGRLWLTVSTRMIPRALAYRSDVADGFIAVIDERGARIVADNIGYANEVYVTPEGDKLFVNATFARQTLSYDINEDNSLSNRQIVGKYGKGIYPDGLTMDAEGRLWITSIISNSLICLDAGSGIANTLLEDVDTGHLEWVENAYQHHKIGRPHLDGVKSRVLQNVSSLAFGGNDLDTIYLGCLLGDAVAVLKGACSGMQPAHWEFL